VTGIVELNDRTSRARVLKVSIFIMPTSFRNLILFHRRSSLPS